MPSAPDSSVPAGSASAAEAQPSIPDYDLVRIVGRGSYGNVWLARGVTGAWRAIKIVWREHFTSAEPFEREFRGLKEFAGVSLGESSQMALLHVGRNDAAGFFYYVMELADDAEHGRRIDPDTYVPLTLAEMRLRDGRIPADECARIGADVARSLASLHRRGLVHRDVKPSNVILVSGVAKLADVGLVAQSASAHTFVGTEGYVPPEGPGAPSADVFALAKVLYELSTGHDRQEFPKLPAGLAALPDRVAMLELNEILLRACGPTSAERYRDGEAILADLTAVTRGVSLRTRRVVRVLLRATAVAALAGLASGGVWWWTTRQRDPPVAAAREIAPAAVAVLPFVNLTGDPEQAYISDGLSDGVLNVLARERSLRVKDCASSFSAELQKLSAVEIGQRLGVARLIQGSLQRMDSRLRANVRLTLVSDGVTENLRTIDHDANDLPGLQDKVSAAVVARLVPRPAPPVVLTTNSEAYHAYLRGRELHVRAASFAPDAAKFYERAVELDPKFAMAWARLADARFRTPGANKDGGALIWEALNRALALDPDLPLAVSFQGMMRALDRDLEGAARDISRAEALQAPTIDSMMYRVRLARETQDRKGIVPLARAAMMADAENGLFSQRLGLIFNAVGEFVDADLMHQRASVIAGPGQLTEFRDRVLLRRRWRGAEAALRLIDQAPSDQKGVKILRAEMLLGLGRIAGARAALEGWEGELGDSPHFARAGLTERARELAREELAKARTDLDAGRHTHVTRILGIRAQLALGDREAAAAEVRALHDQIERRPNIFSRWSAEGTALTQFYAELGQHDIVIDRIRQSIADGFPFGYELRDSASYAGMRNDPRFQQLMKEAAAWAAALPDPPDH